MHILILMLRTLHVKAELDDNNLLSIFNFERLTGIMMKQIHTSKSHFVFISHYEQGFTKRSKCVFLLTHNVYRKNSRFQ